MTGDDDAFPTAPDVAPWAHLGLREEASVFESASQNARVLTEGWVEHALFQPNCGAQPMARFAANRPVADFLCEACREEYELKSQKARLGPRVVDGAWATMQARLHERAKVRRRLQVRQRAEGRVRRGRGVRDLRATRSCASRRLTSSTVPARPGRELWPIGRMQRS